MEFDCFDFENPTRIEQNEEEKRLERIQTSFITIQQAFMQENRQIKQEDLMIKKQNKDKTRQDRISASKQVCQICRSKMMGNYCVDDADEIRTELANPDNAGYCIHGMPLMGDYDPLQDEMDEEEEEEEEDDSQYLLEDEILLDLDFFNKKGDQNFDKGITEKVSIWNDVRPVIQVVAKKNRIEIIYDNGHRFLKDFKFLIKKLEKYKENNEAKLASQLLQEHQKNIEHEENLLDRIMKYYDHEKTVLFDRISKNYESSKKMAYDIIDNMEHPYFAFSIRKLDCEGGIQHLSGPFGYSKPLIDIFGGDMETYIRFIMRKGVIEHFDRHSHFIIFLMKLRIVSNTDLNVVTLDNIKIPISVTLIRHSLSRFQIMPDCYKEDYLKIYKIEIKQDILDQLYEMRKSKEEFRDIIQGLEDFEYFMQSQIFYDKFYKKQRHSLDSAKVCRYRYLDRFQSNRYMGKSQRKLYEEYISNFNLPYKRKTKSATHTLVAAKTKKNTQDNLNVQKGSQQNLENTFHHDISVESQTIKQEEDIFLNDDNNDDGYDEDEDGDSHSEIADNKKQLNSDLEAAAEQDNQKEIKMIPKVKKIRKNKALA